MTRCAVSSLPACSSPRWRRRLRIAGAARRRSTACSSAAAFAKHWHVHQASFTAAGLTRDYWLYLPPGGARAPRPLVVYLHGCNETADADRRRRPTSTASPRSAASSSSTRSRTSRPLERAARRRQRRSAAGTGSCPQDQHRGAGEPAVIAGITRDRHAHRSASTRRRVYVEGVSAGADMAVILGATYPDVYAARRARSPAAPIATCGDETGALAYQAMGARAGVVPMFVENGTADTLNNMAMAGGLVPSWLGADDLADDGAIERQHLPRAGVGDTTTTSTRRRSPAAATSACTTTTSRARAASSGFQGSYPYTVATYDDAAGCDVLEAGSSTAWSTRIRTRRATVPTPTRSGRT